MNTKLLSEAQVLRSDIGVYLQELETLTDQRARLIGMISDADVELSAAKTQFEVAESARWTGKELTNDTMRKAAREKTLLETGNAEPYRLTERQTLADSLRRTEATAVARCGYIREWLDAARIQAQLIEVVLAYGSSDFDDEQPSLAQINAKTMAA